MHRLKKEIPLKEPVEFRELRHPDLQQGSGIIQMWCEVLTEEEAKIVAIEKFDVDVKVKEYEVRLIIWETREIPVDSGKALDLYV